MWEYQLALFVRVQFLLAFWCPRVHVYCVGKAQNVGKKQFETGEERVSLFSFIASRTSVARASKLNSAPSSFCIFAVGYFQKQAKTRAKNNNKVFIESLSKEMKREKSLRRPEFQDIEI